MFALPTLLLTLGCYKAPEHLSGTSGTRYGCSFCVSAVQLDSCVFEQLARNYFEDFCKDEVERNVFIPLQECFSVFQDFLC